MAPELDRIVVAAVDRDAAVASWRQWPGAEPVAEDRVRTWAARRTTLRLGASEVEVLSPDAPGLCAEHLARHGPGVLAIGFTVDDIAGFRRDLDARAQGYRSEGAQTFLCADEGVDLPGIHIVLSAAREHPASAGANACAASEADATASEAPGHVTRIASVALRVADAPAEAERLQRLLAGPGAPAPAEPSQAAAPWTPVAAPQHAVGGALLRTPRRTRTRGAVAAADAPILLMTSWDPRSPLGRRTQRYGPGVESVTATAAPCTGRTRGEPGGSDFAATGEVAGVTLRLVDRDRDGTGRGAGDGFDPEADAQAAIALANAPCQSPRAR